MPADDPLVETWMIHDRISLYLLDVLDDEALSLALPKCRSIHDLYGHVHNVRLLWLKAAAPELLEGLVKIELKAAGDQGPAPLVTHRLGRGDRVTPAQGDRLGRQGEGV